MQPILFGVTNLHVLTALSLGLLEYLKSFEEQNRRFKDGLRVFSEFTINLL